MTHSSGFSRLVTPISVSNISPFSGPGYYPIPHCGSPSLTTLGAENFLHWARTARKQRGRGHSIWKRLGSHLHVLRKTCWSLAWRFLWMVHSVNVLFFLSPSPAVLLDLRKGHQLCNSKHTLLHSSLFFLMGSARATLCRGLRFHVIISLSIPSAIALLWLPN